MAGLMERIGSSTRGGKSTAPGPKEAPPQAPAAPVPSGGAADDRSQGPPSMAPTHLAPVEMAPRTVAPENVVGLSAMRELAKVSAHGAIDKHARQEMIRLTRTKLMIALAGMLAGGALLWMWSAWGLKEVVLSGGLLALMVTLIWGIEYALLSGRLLINKKGHFDWKPTERKQDPVAEQDEEAALARSASGREDEHLRATGKGRT
jgi:hypothetical protein